MEQIDVDKLKPNCWNTNKVSDDSAKKLDESIRRNGMFKPVIVRELMDGTYEIIGGQHRWESCCRLGMKSIPIFNVGAISDAKAKEISIIDNGRYGADDVSALGELMAELGTPIELASFMPFQTVELEAIRKSLDIDLDKIGFDDGLKEDDTPVEKTTRPAKTHVTMRFTVPVANQPFIERVISEVVANEGLDDPDAQINAGEALMRIVRSYEKGDL